MNPPYVFLCLVVLPSILSSPLHMDCQDFDPECPSFSSQGECLANPPWMWENCCSSCCRNEESEEFCAVFKSKGECFRNEPSVCVSACGACGFARERVLTEHAEGEDHEEEEENGRGGEGRELKETGKECGGEGCESKEAGEECGGDGCESKETGEECRGEDCEWLAEEEGGDCEAREERRNGEGEGCESNAERGVGGERCHGEDFESRIEQSKGKDCKARTKTRNGKWQCKGTDCEIRRTTKKNTDPCKDKVKDCSWRRESGECEKSPGWMAVYCAETCKDLCEWRDYDKRCGKDTFPVKDYEYKNAYAPGDWDKLFTELSQRPDTTVLSRPPQGPWIVTVDNFISDVEAFTLINHTMPILERSTDQGEVDEFGVQAQITSTHRTSKNAWCQHACWNDAVVQNLSQRISTLLHVPVKNFEAYQVLEYGLGEKYDVHHDAGADEYLMLSGPRVLTFFLYLSDVEEGGETFFPHVGVKVKPKKGSALLWPSTLDTDPSKLIDMRTEHASLPVIKGKKRAANVWLRARNFIDPHLWGCTGLWPE